MQSKRILKNNRGYTIIELLIAVLVGLILISAVTATYIVQNRSYTAQEGVSEVNTQSKIAHGIIANDIKGAGFGIPDDLEQDPINNFTDIITPLDRDDGPDAITLVGGFRIAGTVWPTGVSIGSACPQYLEVEDEFLDLVLFDEENAAPNTTDNSYLSIDGIQFIQATEVTTGDPEIKFAPPLPRYFPVVDANDDNVCDGGRPIYLVEDVTYCVDDDLVLHRIWRGADPVNCTADNNSWDQRIAENIEDLQFSYALDTNDDGELDDFDDDGTVDFRDGNTFTDPSTIRAVRINILARTAREDPDYDEMGNPPDQIENREHDETNDNIRRRWWRSIVKVRHQQ